MPLQVYHSRAICTKRHKHQCEDSIIAFAKALYHEEYSDSTVQQVLNCEGLLPRRNRKKNQ